jgi:hypothetical protein
VPEVNAALRLLVATRAGRRCEYCLLREEDAFLSHQIDHIISRKHGGSEKESNLALACARCNALKGSDIASIDPRTKEITTLFHPRLQRWEDHFRFDGPILEPLTGEGRATARLLRLNAIERVAERRRLIALLKRNPPARC